MGGGISNSQIIKDEGKYALDAVQNNPNIKDTLASKIKKLETTSPIAMKTITLQNITIDIKSSNGLYYAVIDTFFTDNGINVNNVISITLGTWRGVSDLYDVFIGSVGQLGIMSPISQTIAEFVVKIAYLK